MRAAFASRDQPIRPRVAEVDRAKQWFAGDPVPAAGTRVSFGKSRSDRCAIRPAPRCRIHRPARRRRPAARTRALRSPAPACWSACRGATAARVSKSTSCATSLPHRRLACSAGRADLSSAAIALAMVVQVRMPSAARCSEPGSGRNAIRSRAGGVVITAPWHDSAAAVSDRSRLDIVERGGDGFGNPHAVLQVTHIEEV
jgi:hypothetical protein